LLLSSELYLFFSRRILHAPSLEPSNSYLLSFGSKTSMTGKRKKERKEGKKIEGRKKRRDEDVISPFVLTPRKESHQKRSCYLWQIISVQH